MKTNFLLPSKFRRLGWFLFVPAIIISLLWPFVDLNVESQLPTKVFAIAEGGIFSDDVLFGMTQNSVGDEFLLIFLIVGGLLIGFSKHRNEDEYIAQIRYESLVWATYLNFGIILLATIFVYGTYYFSVLLANLFTLLLFFIIRFQVKLSQLNKSLQDDEQA
ncbi:MAG TPA: hypothetical protein VF581_11510 [Flavobacterium sp.]|jgi:hypothetical protein